MSHDTYAQNPALRPTVLIDEVTKTVYRPAATRELPVRPDATGNTIARETHRAA